jgi:hypothetical protein
MCAQLRLQEQDLREEIQRLTDVRDLEVGITKRVRHREESAASRGRDGRHHEEMRHREEEVVRHRRKGEASRRRGEASREQERLVDQGTERLLAARERERMLGEEVDD